VSTLAQLDPARRGPRGVSSEALAALARGVGDAAGRETVREALRDLAEPFRALTGADVALIRLLDPACEGLEVVAVAGPATLAAELEGAQLPAGDLPEAALGSLAEAPEAVRRAAERAGAEALVLLPVRVGSVAATLELLRLEGAFSAGDLLAAELAGAELALVLRRLVEGPRRCRLGERLGHQTIASSAMATKSSAR